MSEFSEPGDLVNDRGSVARSVFRVGTTREWAEEGAGTSFLIVSSSALLISLATHRCDCKIKMGR